MEDRRKRTANSETTSREELGTFRTQEAICTSTYLLEFTIFTANAAISENPQATPFALSQYHTPSHKRKRGSFSHNEGLQDAAADCEGGTPPPPGRGGGGIAVATGCCCCCRRCMDFSELDAEEEEWVGGMY